MKSDESEPLNTFIPRSEPGLKRIVVGSWMAMALIVTGGVYEARSQNFAGDEALSKVLVPGQGWELVAEGYKFTDAACSDAEGQFYFADVAAGDAIVKVGLDGKASLVLTNAPRISGLEFGVDGRLYACVQSPKKSIMAFDLKAGSQTVIAENVQPNDLAVDRFGHIYFTDTGKGEVVRVSTNGAVETVAKGITGPNGIAVTPDSGSLAVSEYTGGNVWLYRIHSDGSLSAGSRYMELRVPAGKTRSEGDGMTTDSMGRFYVTSALGIQMFDWTGRMGGVISRPQEKGTVSVSFAGPELGYLYACSSDRVYRRKLQSKGWSLNTAAKP